MLLDLKYGMLGQVFVDFGNDPLLHIGVECKPQISQRSRRGDHNECLHLTLARQPFAPLTITVRLTNEGDALRPVMQHYNITRFFRGRCRL
jgi:hypothetical protein